MHTYIHIQKSSNTIKTIFWIVLTVAVASVILTIQIIVYTQNEEVELSIEELKQISLDEEKIFNDYLTPYEMSSAMIEHFGGLNQTLWHYNHFNDLLDNSKDNPYMEEINEIAML